MQLILHALKYALKKKRMNPELSILLFQLSGGTSLIVIRYYDLLSSDRINYSHTV